MAPGVVAGGPDTPEGLDRGFFVRPTVLSGVTNATTVSRQEIFGPVLVLLPYRDENEAVALANDTRLRPQRRGVVVGIPTTPAGRRPPADRSGEDQRRATRDHIRAPFGGYKRSGIGRELGPFGLDEFLELKAVLT